MKIVVQPLIWIFSSVFRLYWEGLSKAILIAVLIIVFTLVNNASEPIEEILKRCLPQNLQFPQMGSVFVFLALPVLMIILNRIKFFRLLTRIAGKIPGLKFLFREKGIQEGIPVAVLEESGLIYGFLRGRSRVFDGTGLVENGLTWWSVFIPSSPVPATSLKPKDFRPEVVREVELTHMPGRKFAQAAIISKCINLGESLGDITLKFITESEVAQMPVLSERDKEEIGKDMSKLLRR